MRRPNVRGVRRRPRRGGIDVVLLRRLPHDSSMQRMSPATKLIALALLTVATLLNTSWAQLAALATVLAAGLIAARMPRRAIPRMPTLFWLALGVGFALALSGGRPAEFIRLVCFTLAFLLLSLLIALTTDLGKLAPTLRAFGAPIRRLGIPADEWASTAALTIRCLPLLLEEARTVLAARRLRPPERSLAGMFRALLDVITASMTAAVRRANDLGEVIAIRGGTQVPVLIPRGAGRALAVGRADVTALILVVAASVLPTLITHFAG